MKELTITATSYLNSTLSIRKNNAWYKAQSTANPTPSTTSQESKKQTQPRKNNAQKDNDKNDNAKKFQTQNAERQARIIKAIQAGTFNPNDYVHEVPKGACVWHGTVHRDPKCTVLSNLLEPTVSKSALKSSNFSNPNPTAKHTMQTSVTARTQTPPPMTDINIMDLDNFDRMSVNSKDNSTNNISHSYSLPNNKISRRVSFSDYNLSNQAQNQHTFVLDSGAFPHMCKDASMFTHLYPWQPSSSTTEVTLADGQTTAKIEGIGTISFELNKHKVVLHNVLLVPSLSESLFSIKQHCVSTGNYFHTENNLATLAFPEFIHTAPISDEIIIKVTPAEKHAVSNRAHTNSQSQTETSPLSQKSDTLSISHNNLPNPISSYTIPVKFLHENAKMPSKGTAQSAGFDLYASEQIKIQPKTRKLINTGIAMAIPTGFYGRIAPRSSLTIKSNIDIGAGVIDSDYRGEIYPCLINNSNNTFNINKGDKIAQIIIEKSPHFHLVQTSSLHNTQRGTGAFGSTDVTTKTTNDNFQMLPQWATTQGTKITAKLPNENHFSKFILLNKTDEFILQNIYDNNETKITPDEISNLIQAKVFLQGHHHKITSPPPPSQTNPKEKFAPLRVIDKNLPSQTSKKSFTMDQVQKAFGFRNVGSIINQIKETNENCLISTKDVEPILDLGQVASIDKPKRNTHPLPFPPNRGDVLHMDIIYGSGKSISGIKYALFIVDRATRYKMMLPIKNLHTDILPNIKKFCNLMGKTPKYVRTDFDHKLIGRHVQQYIEENEGVIESAPPKFQHQNGVCERNWRTILNMARNWLASSLLPSSFWWHSVKRAAEVSNYLPIKLDNKHTTPHELVFGQKPDFQNLFPMFSVAYIDYEDPHTLNIQTAKTILIGRCDISHSLEFFHPHTQRILTSAVYRVDETLTAGPSFGMAYDGGFYFHKFVNTSHQRNSTGPTQLQSCKSHHHHNTTSRSRHIHSPIT